jgi:integrase
MARPRKPKPRRKTSHPGIYDRGDYWQVRIRYTDPDTGERLELENRREAFDPNDADDKAAALLRATAYAASEKATIRKHGRPRSDTPEEQQLRHWLERYRVEVLLAHKDGLIPLPGQKSTAAQAAKIPPHSRGVKYRKGWKNELAWVERWLGIGVVENARFLSPERREQVVSEQAFFRTFFSRSVLGLQPGDFYGRPDSLAAMAKGQKGGDATEATKSRHLAVISAIYKRARSAWGFGEIADPIKALVDKPKPSQRRERPLTPEEWESIQEGLKDAHPTTRAFIRFCRWTATRRGEPVKLRWEHIQGWGTDKAVARLHDTKTPKSADINARTISLHPEAVAAIATTLADPEKPPRSGWVFPSPTDPDKPLPGGTVYQAWQRARIRVGLPTNERGEIPTIHDLRHTRLSELVNSGLELPKMMAVSGHKDTRTALRYYHANASDIGAEIVALEKKGKGKSGDAVPIPLEGLAAALKDNPRLRRQLLTALAAAEAEDNDDQDNS